MRLSRILTPFRRLRWKLTFSYTLATVAAVLALEMVALFALLLLFSTPAIQLDLVQEAAATLAEEVQPFLSASPPDHAPDQLPHCSRHRPGHGSGSGRYADQLLLWREGPDGRSRSGG
jgi:hypothetical protein